MLPSMKAPIHPGARYAGFTALELLVAVAMVSVLASIAYPSFRAQLDRSRRADAVAALIGAQMAQERWRANQPGYGSLAEIGVAPLSGAGHYTIAVTTAAASSYELLASARGAQLHDTECRHLRLSVSGANFAYASGPDPSASNPTSINRRCWSL